MKCVVCGRNEAKINGLCEECFLNSRSFIKPPRNVEVVKCPRCDGVRIGNTWHYDRTVDEAISESLTKNSRILDDRLDVNIKYSIIENMNMLDVEYILSLNGEQKVERHGVPYIFKKQLCPRCSRFSGDYFESIIQIRSDREMNRDEILDLEYFIIKNVENEQKRNPDLYVLKKESRDGGMDYYLSSNSSGRVIARRVAERYGASVKESPHLAGVKEGKDFYRITFSVRLPDYREGDFISWRNGVFRVLAIKRGQIKVINLRTGEIESITQKDLKDQGYRIFARSEDMVKAVKLYEEKDYMHFMETRYYKVYAVKKPSFNVRKEFYIVIDGDDIYIVPEA
jgi:nonsense-mediated mRNA decay protein 3